MTVEIVEHLSLGTTNINHFRGEGTEIIDLETKGEQKWNALLEYLNSYMKEHDMEIETIENGKIWLVSD